MPSVAWILSSFQNHLHCRVAQNVRHNFESLFESNAICQLNRKKWTKRSRRRDAVFSLLKGPHNWGLYINRMGWQIKGPFYIYIKEGTECGDIRMQWIMVALLRDDLFGGNFASYHEKITSVRCLDAIINTSNSWFYV